jgi:hypothetical protein
MAKLSETAELSKLLNLAGDLWSEASRLYRETPWWMLRRKYRFWKLMRRRELFFDWFIDLYSMAHEATT